jgi:hypothetical protein
MCKVIWSSFFFKKGYNMAIRGKATEGQKKLLLGFEIEPPFTKSACSHLIHFLLKVPWRNMDVSAKVAYVKKLQEELLGASVIALQNRICKVQYITVDCGIQYAMNRGEQPDAQEFCSPFRALVVSEDGEYQALRWIADIQKVEGNG